MVWINFLSFLVILRGNMGAISGHITTFETQSDSKFQDTSSTSRDLQFFFIRKAQETFPKNIHGSESRVTFCD